MTENESMVKRVKSREPKSRNKVFAKCILSENQVPKALE